MSTLPPVYVISLARAEARRATLPQRMAGAAYEIVNAVDGAALDLDALAASGRLRQDKCRKLYGKTLIPGEVGCYLSHYAVWERIAAQGQECALVLEDDVEFAEDFFAVVAELVNSPWHWDIVNLATARAIPIKHNLHAVGSGRQFGLSNRSYGCASAYLIRLSGARKLLPYCREIREPLDMAYDRWWWNDTVHYYVSPPAAKQLPQLTSTIGSMSTGSRVEKGALVDRIYASVYRKRERFARWRAVRNHRPVRR